VCQGHKTLFQNRQLGIVEIEACGIAIEQPAVGTDPGFFGCIEQRVIDLILRANEQVAKTGAVVEPLVERRGEIAVRPE
jgi:hypothetical protein